MYALLSFHNLTEVDWLRCSSFELDDVYAKTITMIRPWQLFCCKIYVVAVSSWHTFWLDIA